MELRQAAQRVLRGHWLLILVSLLVGLIIGVVVSAGPRSYSASARLSLGKKIPQVDSEAAALASTARGIATSRTVVIQALRDARLKRDPTQVATNDVSVSSLGTSNIVQLTVHDPAPKSAARLTNALAKRVQQTYLSTVQGQSPSVVGSLDGQLSQLSQQIASIDSQIQVTGAQVLANPVKGVDPLAPLLNQRDVLSRHITTLESARDQIVANNVANTQASIVSFAGVPGSADSSGLAQSAALGGLLGLVLGLGIAALVESVRPGLRGARSVVEAVGAPRLGRLARSPERIPEGSRGLREIATRTQMAASGAGADAIALVDVPPMDLRALAGALQSALGRKPAARQDEGLVSAPGLEHAAVPAGGKQGLQQRSGGGNGGESGSRSARSGSDVRQRQRSLLQIRAFGWDGAPAPGAVGVVVVAAERLAQVHLQTIADVVEITGWPVVGVVTYPIDSRTVRAVHCVARWATSLRQHLQRSLTPPQ